MQVYIELTHLGETTNLFKILVGKPHGKEQLMTIIVG